MSKEYLPPSAFLRSCIADHVPLIGSAFAAANVAQLVAETRDDDAVNRDWAVVLLAETDIDTPEIRQAFLDRLNDEHAAVRAEALIGLARRTASLAAPLVAVALARDEASVPLFEAAETVRDRALLPLLMPWREERSDPPDLIDEALERAIAACGGAPPG